MNHRLHHTNESGSAPAIANESPVTEESLPQPTPNIPPFSGRMFDITTGLQNNLFRWYDPKVGRWTAEDPIGFGGLDSNLYRYVKSKPHQRRDPTGLADPSDTTPTPVSWKLWTYAGINNYDSETKQYVDYVEKYLAKESKIVDRSDKSFASKCGTTNLYSGSQNVYTFRNSKNFLDDEAEQIAKDAKSSHAELLTRDKDGTPPTILLILVAPKTHHSTKAIRAAKTKVDLQVVVLWSPNDGVPNQKYLMGESVDFWKEYADVVHTVRPNPKVQTDYTDHVFGNYCEKSLPTMYWVNDVKKYWYKPPDDQSRWVVDDKKPALGVLGLISAAGADTDFILVAHSQGANIAIHALDELLK